MLKNMLKGILAIAIVGAMSVPAYADVKVGGFLGAAFGMQPDATTGETGNVMTASVDARIKVKATSEKTTAFISLKVVTEPTYSHADETVLDEGWMAWEVTDGVKMSIGTLAGAKIPFLGISGPPPGAATNAIPYGLDPLGISFYQPLEALQFDIALGESTVYAGIYDDKDLGPDACKASYYAAYMGKAGDLMYIVGLRTAQLDGGSSVMGGGVKYMMGAMSAGLEYYMAGDTTDMVLAFNMNELGPGNVNFRYQSQSNGSPVGYDSNMSLAYSIAVEPGASFEVNYNSGTPADGSDSRSFMGVSLAKRF